MGRSRSVRSPTSGWRRSVAHVASAMLALGATTSCGSNNGDEQERAVSSTTSTVADPGDDASDTTAPDGPRTNTSRHEELPPCGAMTSYNTTPDWAVDTAPDGMRLHYANTGVNLYEADALAGFDSATQYLLAEVDPDSVVVDTITVMRFPDLDQFDPFPASSAGHAFDQSSDTVRGHEGAIGRVTNRGDAIGWINARWIEDGVGWIANGNADVDALTSALEALDLSADGVTDPSGRYTVLGSEIVSEPETRETHVELIGADVVAESGSEPTVRLTITEQPESASGIPDVVPLRSAAGALVTDHDGRVALSTGRAVVTTLADGSLIVIEDDTGALTWDDFTLLVDQARRVDSDHPFDGRLSPDWSDSGLADSGYCRET